MVTQAPARSTRLLLVVTSLAYLALRLPHLFGDPFHADIAVNGNLAHALLTGRVLPIAAPPVPGLGPRLAGADPACDGALCIVR